MALDWARLRARLLRFRVVDRKRGPLQGSDEPRANGKHCWTFDGCRNPDGYGRIRLWDGSRAWTDYAHRVSIAAFKKFDLNSDLVAAHVCHNPACFNPWHVRPKTHSDNLLESRDKLVSGKLGQDGADALRRYIKRHKHKANLAKFAASRGVSYASILRAAKGMTYAAGAPLPIGGKLPRPVLTGKPKRPRRLVASAAAPF
jgi:hypothetical protein